MHLPIVEKGNTRIAKYLGLEGDLRPRNVDVFNERIPIYLLNGDWVKVTEMQYHTSWDWLIPLFNKVFLDLCSRFKDFDNTEFRKAYRQDVREFADEYKKLVIHNKVYHAYTWTIKAIDYLENLTVPL